MRIAQQGMWLEGQHSQNILRHPVATTPQSNRTVPNIAEYVEGFVKRGGIRIQVEVPKELRRLEGNREIALCRIIQESLGNIHRRSGSATASLRIFCLDRDIAREIRDKGRGLAAGSDRKNTGVGDRSMQERLRQFGGSLQLESNETGTSVRAVLPGRSSLSMASRQTA